MMPTTTPVDSSSRPHARVVLGPKRARPFFGHHPWVYPGAIAAVAGDPADGAVVDLCSHAGNFIARGLYNSQSKIRVRLLTWNDVPLDENFFRERLRAACHLRHAILGWGGPGQACRLVFSESDGLSGCVVDQYDRWLVLQFTSLGLAQRRELFADLLTELIQPEGIYLSHGTRHRSAGRTGAARHPSARQRAGRTDRD